MPEIPITTLIAILASFGLIGGIAWLVCHEKIH